MKIPKHRKLLIALILPPLFINFHYLSTLTIPTSSLTQVVDAPVSGVQASDTRGTKIVAITDINYAPIAHDWHTRLVSLGYPANRVVIVAADDATLTYFRETNLTTVEPMLHPSSTGWPVAHPSMKGQLKRRRIFSTRWVYVLNQLQNGYSVLLSDADNIFVRYVDTIQLERSGYDVIHAYCHNFPVRFLSMGFTVCGGMVWLKGNAAGASEDGPAVKYVKSILTQCQWSGIHDGQLQSDDNATHDNINSSTAIIHDVSAIHPPPIKAPAAKCDDQQVINSKFYSNSLNYTWDVRPNNHFWKRESSGRSLVTRHKFKFWDVDTAYRGPVDGYNSTLSDDGPTTDVTATERKEVCPDVKKSWVAMPSNAILGETKLDAVEERTLRIKQWYEFCRNETVLI